MGDNRLTSKASIVVRPDTSFPLSLIYSIRQRWLRLSLSFQRQLAQFNNMYQAYLRLSITGLSAVSWHDA